MLSALEKFIEIPSYLSKETNETAGATFLYNLFQKEGIEAHLIEVKSGRKNIIAKMGNENGKCLLLTGHTDTVGLYGNKELLNPRRDPRFIYGRGACDMKGSMIAMVYAMIDLKRQGTPLEGQIVFCGAIDEELSSLGTIDYLNNPNNNVDGAIVGEPTGLEIGLGHRGLEWITFKSEGKIMHSGSKKVACNAIENMMAFYALLVKDFPIKDHEIIGPSTINAGVIKGGFQPSTVPDYCELSVDIRYLPEQGFQEIKKHIDKTIRLAKEKNPFSKIKYEVFQGSKLGYGFFHEPCLIEKENPLVQSVEKAIIEHFETLKLGSFSAWTDGGLLNTYGKIPTLIFGPGNLKDAHSPLERISINELLVSVDIYRDSALNFINQS